MSDAQPHQPLALAELGVTATNSMLQDLTYDIFWEWPKMSAIERHTALVQASDVAGIAYFESDLNIVSIIITPLIQLDRAEWVIS